MIKEYGKIDDNDVMNIEETCWRNLLRSRKSVSYQTLNKNFTIQAHPRKIVLVM